MRGEGFSVNDDNDPAIENVPVFNQEAITEESACCNCTMNEVGFCAIEWINRTVAPGDDQDH